MSLGTVWIDLSQRVISQFEPHCKHAIRRQSVQPIDWLRLWRACTYWFLVMYRVMRRLSGRVGVLHRDRLRWRIRPLGSVPSGALR
jgi:hypothetical protein